MKRAELIEAAARAYVQTFDAADALDMMSPSFTMEALDAASADCADKLDDLRRALALPSEAA